MSVDSAFYLFGIVFVLICLMLVWMFVVFLRTDPAIPKFRAERQVATDDPLFKYFNGEPIKFAEYKKLMSRFPDLYDGQKSRIYEIKMVRGGYW